MFGIPYFDDEKVRDIFGSMMTHAIEEELRTWKSSPGIKFETLAEMQDSGYDSVTLPSDFFEPSHPTSEAKRTGT